MRSTGKHALVALTFMGAVVFGMHVARGQSPPPYSNSTDSTGTAPFGTQSTNQAPTSPQVFYAPTPAPAPRAAPQANTATTNGDALNARDEVSQRLNNENFNFNEEMQDTTRRSRSARPAETPSLPAGTPSTYVPSEVETILPLPTRLSEPRVAIHTSMGVIRGKLYATRTPQSVSHFMSLVRGELEFIDVSSGKKVIRPFYESMVIHRVIAGYLIQTGCPFGNGRGGPGFAIKDEFRPNLRFNKPGMIAMAPQRNGANYIADSTGSQFFITATAAPEFDDKATIIGEVTEGMDVVRKISRVPANPLDKPIRPVQLLKIEIFDEAPAAR